MIVICRVISWIHSWDAGVYQSNPTNDSQISQIRKHFFMLLPSFFANDLTCPPDLNEYLKLFVVFFQSAPLLGKKFELLCNSFITTRYVDILLGFFWDPFGEMHLLIYFV